MKKYIYTFACFAIAILVSRHVVSDLKQEERIWALEQQIVTLGRERVGYDNVKEEYIHHDITESQQMTASINRGKRQRDNRTQKETKKTFDTLKFATPILLELNIVDSATLTKIPGIGAKSASMIIRYREQLGGYVTPYQIGEKLVWESAQEKMDEWCRLWLKADTGMIRKLNVNSAGFKDILRHPYISYEQTKALVNYRDKHRRISGLEVLNMLEEFDENDIERLTPYLSF